MYEDWTGLVVRVMTTALALTLLIVLAVKWYAAAVY